MLFSRVYFLWEKYLLIFFFKQKKNRLNFRKFMIIYVQCRYCKCGRTRQCSCSSIGQSLTVCHSLWLPLDKILVHELSIRLKKNSFICERCAKCVFVCSIFCAHSFNVPRDYIILFSHGVHGKRREVCLSQKHNFQPFNN